MRPSLRFLALVAVGWAGVRAWSLGVIPAGSLSLVEPSEAKPAPPIVPTQFPPIDPVDGIEASVQPAAYADPYTAQTAQMMPEQVRPVMVPVYYGVRTVRVPLPPVRPAESADAGLPEPRRPFYAPGPIYAQLPELDEWPLSRFASTSVAQRRSAVVAPGQSTPILPARGIDRFQVSAWALLRNQQTGVAGATSLASGGSLGASQAGARLTYAINRQVAASLRTSSDVGRRGAELAAGLRVQPIASIPVWLTAERRQRIGRFGGGRNAFAFFAEGGIYQHPMPWQFNLDGYLQGGVVGLHSRDLFVDGALALTRPVYKNFSAGFGVWGGAQPGLYRIDAGPRITMQVRKNVRVHLDWRQRLAGNALPGSGPAVTLATDF